MCCSIILICILSIIVRLPFSDSQQATTQRQISDARFNAPLPESIRPDIDMRGQRTLPRTPRDPTLRKVTTPRIIYVWMRPFLNNATALFDYITAGEGKGAAFDWLAELTDTFGHRQVGSKSLEDAIDFNVKRLRADGFDNVHTEAVPGLPHWERGEATVELIAPRRLQLNVLAVDGSPSANFIAEAIVVESFDELNKSAKNGQIRGKIVIFAQKWEDYGKTVKYRRSVLDVERLGAVGVLIKSVTPFSLGTPHTGAGARGAKIPAACLTVEECEMLLRMQRRGQKLCVHMKFTSRELGTITSRNTIFEITGSEKPKEIVLLSGHFDSWDVGQGALDDGGGCAVMWQVLHAFKKLGLRPKRTVRVIFWTAEEQGFLGSKAYYQLHSGTDERFVFVSESDQGAFRPLNWNSTMLFSGNERHLTALEDIMRLINHFKIPLNVLRIEDQTDVTWWAKEGVPAVNYVSDRGEDYYFYFHHTSADYMNIFKDGDLEYTSAIFAILAHLPTIVYAWIRPFLNNATALFDYITAGKGKGAAFDWLAELTDTFGHRKVGSKSLEDAIDFNVKRLRADGFDNVHTEDVPGLLNWERGVTTVELIEPRRLVLNALAVDMSPSANLVAEAIVVESFTELNERAKNGQIKGKIVIFAQKWKDYISSVEYLASVLDVERLGGVGMLINSVTPFSLYTPHTGFEAYGSEKPKEIVLLSGHFDSWDVGQGALDDGGGCAVMWQVLHAFKKLGLRPKRTLRVVFWTAEELGYLGSKRYHQVHNGTDERFVFVSESDQGAFRPLNWNSAMLFSGNQKHFNSLQDIMRLINQFKIPLNVLKIDDQSDVTWWAKEGVPAVTYISDRGDDYYFYFHHTNADYMTIFKDGDLEYTSAIFAILAHVIANVDNW